MPIGLYLTLVSLGLLNLIFAAIDVHYGNYAFALFNFGVFLYVMPFSQEPR